MTDDRTDLDAAAHSVWLHGHWFNLTRNMTTDEREAFADAVDRHNTTYPPDDQGPPVERWWRDDTPTQPTRQPTISHTYLVVYDHGGIGWAGTDRRRADEFAIRTRSMVAQVPIIADYRAEGTKQ